MAGKKRGKFSLGTIVMLALTALGVCVGVLTLLFGFFEKKLDYYKV